MGMTPYAETEALLAVLNEDDAELARLLGDMLPGERRALARAAERLADASLGFVPDKRSDQ